MPTFHRGDGRLPLRVLLVQDRRTDGDLILAELERAGFEVDHERADDEASMRRSLADGACRPWMLARSCERQVPTRLSWSLPGL